MEKKNKNKKKNIPVLPYASSSTRVSRTFWSRLPSSPAPMAPLRSWKMRSTTVISVAVVVRPQKAAQSLTTIPDPIAALPRLIVPATTGTCRRDAISSISSAEVLGCTMQPLLVATL
ncbi:Eukaryotic translation initiation factor 6 [Angomonas deanei]|nr:Eukaryotic translation initiation factor 6 [Angomonas deanei]|eukprot:EPY39467.1 Eukaryotic translation initiation factor 6 [Angomonas deanei]